MATLTPDPHTTVVCVDHLSPAETSELAFRAQSDSVKGKKNIPLWAESLLWIFVVIAMSGMVAQFANSTGFSPPIALKIVMSICVALFAVTIVGCVFAFNIVGNARVVMLSSLAVSSLLHVILLYISGASSRFGSLLWSLVGYGLVMLIMLVLFSIFLYKSDGFDRSVVGKSGSRALKVSAFISMSLYAVCLIGSRHTIDLTFVAALVSLILSSGVWIVYTGIRLAKNNKQIEVLKVDMLYP
jgi:hypothetical protein